MEENICLNFKKIDQTSSNIAYSNGQKIWHLTLFSIASLGLYAFYWFYRNNKQLYQRISKR